MRVNYTQKGTTTTDQFLHDSADNFASVATTDKDDCSWVLDFLWFTSFQSSLRPCILGFSGCVLDIGSSKKVKVTHTTRSMVRENTPFDHNKRNCFVTIETQYNQTEKRLASSISRNGPTCLSQVRCDVLKRRTPSPGITARIRSLALVQSTKSQSSTLCDYAQATDDAQFTS